LSLSARARLFASLLGLFPAVALPQPDSGYPSAQAAFVAAFITSGVGQRGYDENREYAAALYQMPDGRWYATPAEAGDQTKCRIPYDRVPSKAIRVAGAHTHGQPHLPGDADHEYGLDFSRVDVRNSVQAFSATHGRIDSQWLLTSRMKVLEMRIDLQFDPASERIGTSTHKRDWGDWTLLVAGDPAVDGSGGQHLVQ
jgi:hypothetical protein